MLRKEFDELIDSGRLDRVSKLISNTPETSKFLVLGEQEDGTWLISIYDPLGLYFNLGGYHENYEEALTAYQHFLHKYTRDVTDLLNNWHKTTDSVSDAYLDRLIGRYDQDSVSGEVGEMVSPFKGAVKKREMYDSIPGGIYIQS